MHQLRFQARCELRQNSKTRMNMCWNHGQCCSEDRCLRLLHYIFWRCLNEEDICIEDWFYVIPGVYCWASISLCVLTGTGRWYRRASVRHLCQLLATSSSTKICILLKRDSFEGGWKSCNRNYLKIDLYVKVKTWKQNKQNYIYLEQWSIDTQTKKLLCRMQSNFVQRKN